MIPQVARLYNPAGPDRLAVVSAEPSAAAAGAYLIRLARGSLAAKLTKGTVYGPYPEAELPARFQEVVDALKAEGFLPTGVPDALAALHDPSTAVRARAALKLGWRRTPEAVQPILALMPAAVDDVCSFMDALGMLGDSRAIPVLRAQAARKLLSRRRS